VGDFGKPEQDLTVEERLEESKGEATIDGFVSQIIWLRFEF
jgi:hypothetical protein